MDDVVVRLRAFRVADAAALLPHITPSLCEHMTWSPPPDANDLAVACAAQAERGDLVFSVMANDMPAGMAELQNDGGAGLNVAIWIAEALQNRGYGAAALRRLLGIASALGEAAVRYQAVVANDASNRLAVTVGGKLMSRGVLVKGTISRNSFVYSIPCAGETW